MQKGIQEKLDSSIMDDDVADKTIYFDDVEEAYKLLRDIKMIDKKEFFSARIKYGIYNNTVELLEIYGNKMIYQPNISNSILINGTENNWELNIEKIGEIIPPTIIKRRIIEDVIGVQTKFGIIALISISSISTLISIISWLFNDVNIATLMLGPAVSGTIGLYYVIKMLNKKSKFN